MHTCKLQCIDDSLELLPSRNCRVPEMNSSLAISKFRLAIAIRNLVKTAPSHKVEI